MTSPSPPLLAPTPSPSSPSKADMEAATPIHATDPISKVVVDTGRRHTFYANSRGVRFNLVALHRMNMHYLRKRLIDESAKIFTKGSMDDDNSKVLTDLMRDYCLLSYLPTLCAAWEGEGREGADI